MLEKELQDLVEKIQQRKCEGQRMKLRKRFGTGCRRTNDGGGLAKVSGGEVGLAV